MKLAKLAKKPPREIAQEIADSLSKDIFLKVEVAGPGFINLTLNPEFLSEQINRLVHDPRLGISLPKKNSELLLISPLQTLPKRCM